ncbi:MAG: ribosome silencing factor [Planctomycetaceae bacterium]
MCAQAADEFRGKDIVILDLRKITPVFDFFVIVTAGSPRLMRSIAEESDRLLKLSGSRRLGAEGHDSATWILHDYGDVVLHIFSAEARANYDLERLWADAPQVPWQSLAPSSGTTTD